MKTEHEIIGQIRAAQRDPAAADEMVQRFLPFIKAETVKYLKRPLAEDGDDALSIAMFAFYEAMMAYEPKRGAFLKLAAVAIKNRLIDHSRRERRHSGILSLDQSAESGDGKLGDLVADQVQQEEALLLREAARAEIAHFARQLEDYGLTLSDVAENCPKQSRTLAACMQVLHCARQDSALLWQLEKSKKLPVAALAEASGVERKTIERHRRYLVAVLLAFTNGFELIREHLCQLQIKEVRQ